MKKRNPEKHHLLGRSASGERLGASTSPYLCLNTGKNLKSQHQFDVNVVFFSAHMCKYHHPPIIYSPDNTL